MAKADGQSEDFIELPLEGCYPVKDRLKEIGCRWSPERKCWMAPRAAVMMAKVIIQTGDPNANLNDEGEQVERWNQPKTWKV